MSAMKSADSFAFIISPEPSHTTIEVTTDNYVEIAFVVRNISGTTVRAEPLINPLPTASQVADQAADASLLLGHLQILESGEWEFEHGAVRTYRVRANIPNGFQNGDYRFQLLMVGIDDPDHQVSESDEVTLTVHGPALNPRPFLLAALGILVAVILLAVGAALFLRSAAQVEVVFDGDPPAREMTEGKLESYTLKIRNLRQEPLDNVVLEYSLPPGLMNASAFVRDSSLRNCDRSSGHLHCDLGSLAPNKPIFVTFQVLAGPRNPSLTGLTPTSGPTATREPTTKIDHFKTMTFTRQLKDKTSNLVVELPQAISTVRPASQPIYLAIDPAQSVALTGEVLNYDILAWSHSPVEGPFTLTYTLPPGLTYVRPLPSVCSQEQTHYFTLTCTLASIQVVGPEEDVKPIITVHAVAFSPQADLLHHVTLQRQPAGEDQTSAIEATATASAASIATSTGTPAGNGNSSILGPIPTIAASATATTPPTACGGKKDSTAQTPSNNAELSADVCTSAVSTALMFDGVSDWVDLGFNKGLPTFTAEMWVHPFTTDDGQAFIGVHRQAPDTVDNMFLVGYYDDAFSVTVNGEYYNLAVPKMADRFHLAVAVKQVSTGKSLVVVYINGEAQPWQEPEAEGVCQSEGSSTDKCKLFGSPTTNSLLDGQDTMHWVLGQDWDQGSGGPKTSDFFYGSLSEVRLWNTARTQDQIVEGMRQRPHGDEAGLVAYWRLEPVNGSSDILGDRASGQYPAKRIQANWDDITPRFGAALAFSGSDNALSVDDLHLSDFAVKNGKVELTMAGWFYVDGVPSRQQWLLGSAAPGFGLGPNPANPAPPATAAQSDLAQAQADLLSALQARQALNLDPAEGQAAVLAARNEVYQALGPLASGFDPVTYDKTLKDALENAIPSSSAAVSTTASPGTAPAPPATSTPMISTTPGVPSVLTTMRDKLIAAPGSRPELVALDQTERSLHREEHRYEQAQGAKIDFEIVRSKYRLEAARRAYAQALADVWKLYARDSVTVPGLLTPAFNPLDAERFQAQIDSLETGLAQQPLAVRALNSLAVLELREENLTESLLSGQALSESPQAQQDALSRAQTDVDTSLAQNEAYLQSLLGLQSNAANGAGSPASTSGRPNLGDPDLVSYWKFDEGNGPFTHAYGDKPQAGLLSGGAAFISSSPPLAANPFALAFNGGPAAVRMESTLPSTGAGDLTVAFWISPQESGQVLDIGATTDSQDNFTCSLKDLKLTCTYAGKDATVDLKDYRGAWTHVAFQYSAGQRSLIGYFHAAPVQEIQPASTGSTTTPTALPTGTPTAVPQSTPSTAVPPPTTSTAAPGTGGSGSVRLGSLSDTLTAFTGLLDELVIYRRALTPQEIAQLAGSPLPAQPDPQLMQRLDGLRAVQALRQAQANLNAVVAADARLAQAQQATNQAGASAELVKQAETEAHQSDAQYQARQDAVIQAQAAVDNAATGTSTDKAAAQQRLAQAQADLQAARQQQFQNLDLSITLLQQREQILVALSPRLDEAVEKSVDAAQAALQRNNVELLVGPYLDWILGTSTPRKNSYQAAYPAALLAAQLALKPEADAKVDVARAKYDAAVEARDRLVNSSGASRLQQQIIDNINKYIEALNGEVNQAKAELDKAVEEQRTNQSDSPLQSILAEALAEAVAQRVTDEIAARYPINPISTVTPDPRLADAIKTQLKGELFNNLESVRRPVRWGLYYQTFYAIQRLDQELAAGIDSAPQRAAKTNLRTRLMELDLALLRVIYAQSALLRPAVGFQDLLKQVADESDRATQIDQLIQALDQALKNASDSLATPGLDFGLPAIGVAKTNQGETAVPGNGSGPLQGTPQAGGPATNSTTPQANSPVTGISGTSIINGSVTATPSAPTGLVTPSPITGTGGTVSSNGSVTATPSAPVEVVTSPPNIWAGLILTDDGHVAVVARPAGAATWSIRKDERPIPVGRWVHYAAVIVYDAQTGQILVDENGEIRDNDLKLFRNGGSAKGVPRQAGADEIRFGAANCPPNFYIGGLCPGNERYNFSGKIDEVRIWNRALSASDIDLWRNLPGQVFDEVGYWSYDDILGGARPEGCKLGQTCDLAGTHNLTVIGPAWVPADPNLLRVATSRQ